jgi:NAD(P)-dependent dehydrogenase (short-subunit alcohol dehydrogenase family)
VEQTPEALSEEMFNNESFDSWADTYRINVSSYYFTASAFLPLLAKAQTLGGAPEPGNIINIASISDQHPPTGQFGGQHLGELPRGCFRRVVAKLSALRGEADA